MNTSSTSNDKIRVLHVDDEDDQLHFTKKFLEFNDPLLIISSIKSPKKALELIEKESFDCIVSDYKMHELDGIRLAEKVREKSNVPFVLYTGQGSEEVAERAYKVGIDDYIRKEMDPSHYQVLARRIRDTVEKYWVEDLYRIVVEDTREAISIILGNKREYANKALADIYQVDNPSDLIGKIVLDNISEEDRDYLYYRVEARQRGEQLPRYFQYNINRADGEKED